MQVLTLGDGLHYLRERAALSARQVSLAAGLSPSYVRKVEKNEIEPTVSSFYRICKAVSATDKEILLLLKLVTNGHSG